MSERKSSRAQVTVCLPVKAHDARYLREAVDSVASQSSDAWELVIVVEPEVSEPVSQVLAGRLGDPRVRVLTNEGRRLAGAFNTGMHHAGADFVAILLGDDLWAPNAIEVLSCSIERHPDIDFFHSARIVVDEQSRPVSDVHPARREVRLEDFGRSSPVKHLLCWRRRLALSFGGMDESLESVGVDDFDFPWTMAEHGARFHAIPECLYLYRDHRDHFRLTTHLPRSHHKREIARIMLKHGVDRATVRAWVAKAETTFLRECLYRSRADRWLKQLYGFDPRSGPRRTWR
jgi:glycosyltransferase involved in cell wall biosynthesis